MADELKCEVRENIQPLAFNPGLMLGEGLEKYR